MPADDQESRFGPDPTLPGDEIELWEGVTPGEHHALVDLINRVLDRGVVITGEITISVAGVDLVYLGLNALLTSVSTARRVIDARIGGGGPPETGGID